jgi:hypothetical protein
MAGRQTSDAKFVSQNPDLGVLAIGANDAAVNDQLQRDLVIEKGGPYYT